MAKSAKPGKKSSGGGANSHVRARINYLHKAAAYLQSAEAPATGAPRDVANQEGEDKVMSDVSAREEPHTGDTFKSFPQLARVCISQMRGVSQKSQLRLPIEHKRSFCKRCDTMLILGTNCTHEIRNPSRGGQKPWAEVLVVRCNTCGTEKRFPRTDKRSSKLLVRKKNLAESVKPA